MNFSKKNHELKKSNRKAVSKTLYLIITLLLISTIGIAQNGINYKAIIKDTNGNVLVSSPVSIQFIIYEGAALTNNVYQENHTINTDINGFIITHIGEGATSDVFNSINWSNDEHFLNVQVNSGSGLVDLGTTAFKTVPYAKVAENVSGLEEIDEGNGIGWRLKGRDTIYSSNIGLNALDFTLNEGPNSGGARGELSTAFGYGSLATGLNSFAVGTENIASGAVSTVFGVSNTSSGFISFAIGGNTNASGFNSFSAGLETTADSYSSFALGRSNIGGGNPTSWVDSDPLFEIGNGTNNSNRRNALTILKDGTILQHSSLNTYDELVGAGAAAFGNQSFAAGDYSLTAGNSNEVYGDYAIALGSNNTAAGENSIAVGLSSVTSGEASAAFGRNSFSEGDYSFSAGYQARAFGYSSISLGRDNYSSGSRSVSIGSSNNARSVSSATIGAGLESNIMYQLVLGRFNEPWPTDFLSSWGSTVPLLIIGNGSNDSARSNALTILGSGFTGIGIDNPQEQLHINGRLRIGNETIEDGGTDVLAFSSSLVPTVDEEDRLGGPNRKWLDVWAMDGTINTSDRREKKNISALEYGLAEILQMQPVSFNWKSKNSPDTKLGLIAQDVQTLIPEVVKTHIWKKDEATGTLTKKELDRLGVYYSDLVPVLIKAIQEQQKVIDSLKTALVINKETIKNQNKESSKQSKVLETLLSRVDALEYSNN